MNSMKVSKQKSPGPLRRVSLVNPFAGYGVVYVCQGNTMQHAIKCDSQDKPGKNEVVRFMPTMWIRVKDCPDCDRKRTTVCKDPTCGRRK